MKKISIVFSAIFALNVFAAPPVLTGKCGVLLNMMKKGVIIEDDIGLSGLGMINFDTRTAVGSLISFDSTKPKKAKIDPISWTFSIKEGYFVGSAILLPSDSKMPTVQILPVNGGNSYLLHVIDSDSVGVCQKI